MQSTHDTRATTISDGRRTPDMTLDDLPLRDAIISDGLVLVEGPRRAVTLYTLDRGRVHHLGTFDDPAQAWALLDALDRR